MAYSLQIALGMLWAAFETVKTRNIAALIVFIAAAAFVCLVFYGIFPTVRESVFAALSLLTMPMIIHIFWWDEESVRSIFYPGVMLLFLFILWIFYMGKRRLFAGTIAAIIVLSLLTAAASGISATDIERRIRQSIFARIAYIKLDESVEETFGNKEWLENTEYKEYVYFATKRVVYADELKPEFCSDLEEKFGTGVADKVYDTIEREAISQRLPRIVKETLWDVTGYLISPPVVLKQSGNFGYENLSGRNYDRMRRNSPLLAKRYYFYGIYLFLISGATALCYSVIDVFSGKKPLRDSRMILFPVFLSTVLAVALSLRGAGLFDYRLSLGILAAEMIFILSCLIRKTE